MVVSSRYARICCSIYNYLCMVEEFKIGVGTTKTGRNIISNGYMQCIEHHARTQLYKLCYLPL